MVWGEILGSMSSDQHSIYIVQWLQVLSGTAKNPIGMDYMGPKGWMDGEPEWIYAMSYNIAHCVYIDNVAIYW